MAGGMEPTWALRPVGDVIKDGTVVHNRAYLAGRKRRIPAATAGRTRTASPRALNALPPVSTGVLPYVSRTCAWVGTTTMSPGESCQGPLAPCTCQLGK